ncbi:MAG: hydroxymethylglutaryl-CoA synthase [Candidatus Aenigmatarchaeota archaeon]
MTNVGIEGYGVCIPRERIKTEEIVKERESWRRDLPEYLEKIRKGLLLNYKAIAGPCEDSTTLAAEAAGNAFRMSGINPKEMGKDPFECAAVYVGSESKPYAVGTIAVEVASFFGMGPYIFAPDEEGACNAGMQAVSDVRSKVLSGEIHRGLAIGTDVAQAPIGDPLEYACGAGAGAFLIGRDNLIAELYDVVPFSTNERDFFRREGMLVPKHFGKTTVKTYLTHVIGGIVGMLKKHPDKSLEDFDYITAHQPSGYMVLKTFKTLSGESKDPFDIDKMIEDKDLKERIKLTPESVKRKVEPWLTVLYTGNTYAASTPIAVANILDNAKPGEEILAVSYGSGASSIATWIKVLDGIEEKKGIVPSVREYIERFTEISLKTYIDRLKERFERWVRNKHLIFPKIIGEIEPIGNERIEITLCDDCKTIYYPAKNKCLNPDCKEEKLIRKYIPKRARLKNYEKPFGKPALRKSVYHVLKRDKVILVDCDFKDLEIGMELEPVIRRFDYQGKDGLIQYGPALRPIFRNKYKTKSNCL